MTPWAHRLANVVGGCVLAASGTYLLVYLYRWEWNRAMVAGVIFVAAETGMGVLLVLRRLRQIETRLRDETLLRLRESRPEPRDRFEWLERQSGSFNVFVPVLLGLGVILSALAAVVERVASAGANPSLERQLARRLGVLALPQGGLVGPAPLPAPILTHPNRRVVSGVFVVLCAVLLGVAGVNTLADNTQDGRDVVVPGVTEVRMTIAQRDSHQDTTRLAEAFFVACRHTLGNRYTLEDLTVAGTQVTMHVSPRVGKHGARRLTGCLQDGLFDRVWGTVGSVRDIR